MPRKTGKITEVSVIIKNNSGILLDIGCGRNKQPGWVGMDVLDVPGVDIVWDVNKHPWPIPDESVRLAMTSHLVEHIPPVAIDPVKGTWFPFIEFMNEIWRVLKPDGSVAIACPHGYSPGYLQDPTHCNALNEATWAYFDPLQLDGLLYGFYQPKPWKIVNLSWDVSANMEVVMVKRLDDPSYHGGAK